MLRPSSWRERMHLMSADCNAIRIISEQTPIYTCAGHTLLFSGLLSIIVLFTDMSTAYATSDLVDRLTIDMWAKIFSHLSRSAFALSDATEEHDEGAQAAAFRLRLVCKKFNQAFAHPHSGQTKCLLLRQGLQQENLPSLLAWVHRSHGLCELGTFCNSEYTELVMAKLSYTAQLRVVDLINVRRITVHLLSAFQHVVICKLQAVGGSIVLDLSALKSLDSLRCLRLCNGPFANVHLPMSVQHVWFDNAHIAAAQSITMTNNLCSVRVFNSCVEGLHAHGLSACQNLQDLQLCNARVHAENVADILSASTYYQDVWPSSLLRLKKLSFLYVSYENSQGHSKLNSMFGLTQLKELCLEFAHSVFIGNDLAKLSSLQVLTLQCAESDEQSESCIECVLDWHKMSSLQWVTFGPGRFKFSSEVEGLAKLDHLEQVSFRDFFCHDHHTVDVYAALMFQLALCAPDVDVVMEKSDVAKSQNNSLLTFGL